MNVAERMSEAVPHPEMAFRSIRGLLRLEHKYTRSRVEKACCRALDTGMCRYKTIKNMLQNNLEGQEDGPETVVSHSNIRGAAYYTTISKEKTNAG